MMNPKDIEMLDDEEQRKLLDPEFLKEFEGGLEDGESEDSKSN